MIIPFHRDGYDAVECCVCGLVFLVPDMWCQYCRNAHCDFWCPNGHNLHFPREDNPVATESLPEPAPEPKKWWRFWR